MSKPHTSPSPGALLRARGRQGGFALGELLLTIAAISALVGIGTSIYANVRASARADEQGQVMVDVAANMRKYIGKAQGDYTGTTAARVVALGFTRPPLRWDGTNLSDAWGNTMTVYGWGPFLFSMSAGGTQRLSPSECAAIVARLANSAYMIRVGTSTSITSSGANNGWVENGNLYKTGTTINQAALNTGCSENNAVIGATFLER